ncbi:unnamed protein product [Linum trigynum]|uniref:Uncharacterized protein n=1 Tax=Linum trigynum TaxID=586398 RepID=A0AAV2GSU6_9ROSI
MDCSSSSSSWSNLPATYSRRRAVTAVLVAASYLTMISRNVAVAKPPALHYCSSSHAAEDPAKYYSNAEKVMSNLVKRAPYSWTHMFKAWLRIIERREVFVE